MGQWWAGTRGVCGKRHEACGVVADRTDVGVDVEGTSSRARGCLWGKVKGVGR